MTNTKINNRLERLRLAAAGKKQENVYWTRQLSGEFEKIGFPVLPGFGSREINGGGSEADAPAGVTPFRLEGKLFSGLTQLAGNSDIRLHILLTSALMLLLAKYTGNNDISVGTPILAPDRDGEVLNGTLVLRCTLNDAMNFKDLVLRVRERAVEADRHRNYPLELLAPQPATGIDHGNNDHNTNRDRSPFFDVAVLLENIHNPRHLAPFEPGVIFSFSRTPDRIDGGVHYDVPRYDGGTINRIIDHFCHLLATVLDNPAMKIRDIEWLLPREKEQLLFEFNPVERPFPEAETIHGLFARQGERTPDCTALTGKGWIQDRWIQDKRREIQLSYRELDRRSSRLAAVLTEHGVEPGAVVALMTGRCIEMIVGMLGILKTGAAYLPLNPRNPAERTRIMRADSGARLLVTTGGTAEHGRETNGSEQTDTVRVEHTEQGHPGQHAPLPGATDPAGPAYIIYTSGSTGKPKGVRISHANFSPLVRWGHHHLGITPKERVIQNLSYYFDWSVWEIFIALTTGAGLFMITDEILLNPSREVDFIRSRAITALHITPTQFRHLAATGVPMNTLKYLFLGAEKLTPDLLAPGPIPAHCRIFNMYGPTEATIVAAVLGTDPTKTEKIDEYRSLTSVPIGVPVGNATLAVMDHHMNLCPIGVTGELYIYGDGVAAGYLNDPELTARKFHRIYNISYRSYQSYNSYQSYQTGDRARWLVDGTVEFLGRTDHQVKIRGYRIETGEIENHLLGHRDVRAAVVVPRDGENRETYLCAYVVLTAGDSGGLRSFLSARLPDYMVPRHVVPLEKIPLNANGKVDTRALPEPAGDGAGAVDTVYAAPRNEVEQELVRIWSGILGIPKDTIGIDADFFELGGHSLRATTVTQELFRTFGVKIGIEDMFSHPTVREMARKIAVPGATRYEDATVAEEKEYYPLSYAQRRLWVLCQFEEDSTAYNMPWALTITGDFRPAVFERAVRHLARRHDSLRTVFISVEGEPVQKINRVSDDHGNHDDQGDPGGLEGLFRLEVLDLSHLPADQREKETRGLYLADAARPFDLAAGPLFRFKVVRHGGDRFILIHNMHHIITDGWSQGIIFRETVALYNALLTDETPSLPPPMLQYRDYTLWHNALIKGRGFAEAGAYWLDLLKDKPNGIELPLDHPRKPVQTFNGGRVSFMIPAHQRDQLYRLGLKEDATLFMTFLTLVGVFLYRYSGQADVILGSPIANRKRPELHGMVGFLVNTLVYRNRVEPGKSFRGHLRGVRERALTSYRYQDYPFDLLVEQLDLERDLSRPPLFNVMLAHNNTEAEHLEQGMKGVEISGYRYSEDFNMSKFDLLFALDDEGDRVVTRIEYNSDLFDHGTIARMRDNFLQLLNHVTEGDHADEPVSGLGILTPDEYDTVVHRFNSTRQPFEPLTLQELFEGRVEKEVEKNLSGIAVSDPANGREIGYGELNRRANQLAHFLRAEKGMGPNRVIGVSLERSVDMITVLWGIIKSGAAYLAVDPTYPRERVLHVLQNSRSDLLIIDRMRPELFGDYTGDILDVTTQWDRVQNYPTDNPRVLNQPADMLYVNYTSGSTGMPNGAMLSHDCLTNLIQWQLHDSGIDCSLRCLQFTSINFCVSFQEIAGTLTAGGELFLIGDIQRRDIDYLMDFLSTHRIGVLFLPFSYLNFLFNQTDRWDREFHHDLQHIITAGEQLKITAGLQRFLDANPHLKLHNHYGSTEMHVVTSYTLDASTAAVTPIPPAGKPIANVGIYILDDDLNPVPVGVWGELFVRGRLEILGYIGNHELTDQKLVPHPELSPEERLYRSGDVGRWLENGNIELRGRKDFMVKIRGFRIELGEVESKILSLPGVRECVVVDREDAQGRKNLYAYLSMEGIGVEEIKRGIGRTLPQYMIPHLVVLDALPLMPNGKTDRQRLPEPVAADGDPLVVGAIEPGSETEAVLLNTWCEVLEIEPGQIGMESNFFQVGGHSLKATVMVSRIRRALGVDVPLLEVFQNPTIRDLAAVIDGLKTNGTVKTTDIPGAEKMEYYELSYNQERLWIINRLAPDSSSFNMPGRVDLYHGVSVAAVKRTLAHLAQRHHGLRTRFAEVKGQPVQVVEDGVDVPLEYIDLSGLAPSERESRCDQLFHGKSPGELAAPFRLDRAPLLRVMLVKLDREHYRFMFAMHHIISDGWSMELLKREFTTLYDAYRSGDASDDVSGDDPGPGLPPLEVQYTDFARWQRRRLADPAVKDQYHRFWLPLLENGLPTFQLPGDRGDSRGGPTMGVQDSAADCIFLPHEVSTALAALAAAHHTTVYLVLFSVFNLLLSNVGGTDDIITGVLGAGRQKDSLQHIVGFFVNTMIYRSRPDHGERFDRFLAQTTRGVMDMMDKQDYPLELVLEELKTRFPKIPVLFNMFSMTDNSATPLDPKRERYLERVQETKFEMVIYASQYQNGLDIQCHYWKNSFKQGRIQRMTDRYAALLEAVARDPGKKIKEYFSVSHGGQGQRKPKRKLSQTLSQRVTEKLN